MNLLHLLLAVLVPSPLVTHETSTQHPLVTPHNSSEIVLSCAPAENFIQTHMAPDFESPQLVRRLDWFHDDTLVASYQQVSGLSFLVVVYYCLRGARSCIAHPIISPFRFFERKRVIMMKDGCVRVQR
ncbi:unnamed protein product [Heligmosomoides polygyrus]|uniref:Secreted protein n=1 Tax=Heligmosomoides polygyrus TaxID=6339 RepID=A0A183FZD8_HELPZ|nr:unnamed protein product [Heligmosomoides polygyrus]